MQKKRAIICEIQSLFRVCSFYVIGNVFSFSYTICFIERINNARCT